MSHSCEKDQCSSCLWKPYHSCLTDVPQHECETQRDRQWCGNGGNRAAVRVRSTKRDARVDSTCSSSSYVGAKKTAASAKTTATPSSACGSCKGCLWTAVGPAQGCYTTWNKATCDAYAPDYQWCGDNVPPATEVFCCDKSTNPPSCNTVQGTSCPSGTTQVSACNGMECQSDVKCANPYYSGGTSGASSSSCGVASILPNNATGLARWLKIFPNLDPSSPQYAAQKCDSLNTARDQMWSAGCLMFGQGGMNGLSAFLQAASQFTAFANGPDPRRNIIELASFFGNVSQETSGLLYSAEVDSTPCQSSMFGKGPLQLTGTINYQLATLGLNKPSDFNDLVSKQYTLSGVCATTNLYPPADACWAQCAAATPTPPPQGAGYNYCAKPWLASGLNDLGAVPKMDPVPSWASALWYWMNVPIQTSIAQQFYGIQGDVSCATAHNLIQDPMYNCGEWCPVTAIAQVGCPSCCTNNSNNAMTVNRIGHFVQIAGILGLPEAQGTAANDLFCTLMNTCYSGNPNSKGSTCPTGYSYQCYLDGTCGGGGGGGSQVMCGSVSRSLPAPTCVAVPGNKQAVTQAQCNTCLTPGTTWWPCNDSSLCQWGTTPSSTPMYFR